MTRDDPTDHALAAIASMLDLPEAPREPETRQEPEAIREAEIEYEREADIDHESEARHEPEIQPEPLMIVVEEEPLAPEMIEPSGYSKIGPGPMAAIRFRWTVRHEANDEYYVDETIGENGSPITAGPMSGDAAIKLVDDRESEAQRRFEQLRNEMIGRPATFNLVPNESNEE